MDGLVYQFQRAQTPYIGPRESLQQLLRGASPYDGEGAGTTLAPFRLDRVSLPESAADAPRIETLLGHADRELLDEYVR